MKVFLSFLFLTTVTATVLAEPVGENHLDKGKAEASKPIKKAFEKFIEQKVLNKEKVLSSPQALMENLTRETDQEEIKKILKKNPNIKIVSGKFINGSYVIKLDQFTISILPQDYLKGVIRINDVVFDTNQFKSLSELFVAIDNFVDKNTKKTSLLPNLINFIINSANADSNKNNPFKDILKINSAGAIYLTFSKAAIWRDDKKTFTDLMDKIEKDIETAMSQCRSQQGFVQTKEQSSTVYYVLNKGTRDNLLTILDEASKSITEKKVLGGLFARYAFTNEHGEDDKDVSTCNDFLNQFTEDSINHSIHLQITQRICPQMSELTTCLNDLYAKDKRINSSSRNSPLKIYSGERYDSDENHLDQIVSPSKSLSR